MKAAIAVTAVMVVASFAALCLVITGTSFSNPWGRDVPELVKVPVVVVPLIK